VDAPKVADAAWARSDLDRFLLAALEAKKLTPVGDADKRTLLRRVYYDLIGLPPTRAETEAFLTDRAPDAFAKVVDRLLSSPHYGERWGRHWLDVARYADTKGYVGGEELRYAYAYTYRDWVIRALNEDLPYDQFLTQQIAADLLPPGTDTTYVGILIAFGALDFVAWREGARLRFRRRHLPAWGAALFAVGLAAWPMLRVGYLTAFGGEIDSTVYVSRATWMQEHGLLVVPPRTTTDYVKVSAHDNILAGFRQGDQYALAFTSSVLSGRFLRLLDLCSASTFPRFHEAVCAA